MNPPIIVNSPEKGKDSLTYSAVFFVRLFLTGFGFGATSSEEDFGVTGFLGATFLGTLAFFLDLGSGFFAGFKLFAARLLDLMEL